MVLTDGATRDAIVARREGRATRQQRRDGPRPHNDYAWFNALTGQGVLSSNFYLAARTLPDIYKARWKIELFPGSSTRT
ncbi:hypothetical protein ACS8Y6_17875 [Salinisphaera sp. RV14]|uniref:hypothetical protein n=1 Tax=unclassified Salinisphaera TaxID=2649847 RepID=UPI003F82D2D8